MDSKSSTVRQKYVFKNLKRLEVWCAAKQTAKKAGKCSTWARLSAVPFLTGRQRSRELWHPEHRGSGNRTEERMVTRLPEAVITVITAEEFHSTCLITLSYTASILLHTPTCTAEITAIISFTWVLCG